MWNNFFFSNGGSKPPYNITFYINVNCIDFSPGVRKLNYVKMRDDFLYNIEHCFFFLLIII